MADIVSFPDQAGRRTPDLSEPDLSEPGLGEPGLGEPATPEENRAEIVIFPGVRIERQDFTPKLASQKWDPVLGKKTHANKDLKQWRERE